MPLLRFGRALPTTLREWNRVLQDLGLTTTDGELTVSDASPDGPVTLGLADHGTAGTYLVVTTDAKGRVTSGRALLETDIPAEIARDTEVAAAITAAVDAHEAKADPHPVYLTQAEGDARYALVALSSLLRSGTGSPEGAVAAPVGTLYLRTDGSTGTVLYVKETGAAGNTGWAAK